MKCFTFAHKGESQVFLKKGHYLHCPFAFDGLYRNEDSFLLIHGEGLQNTTQKLSAFLGSFIDEITVVLNYGICGSFIPEKYTVGEILPIRTCYAEGEFKSFSTPQGSVDIISSRERVLDKGKAKNLAPFAPLVDREAWAVGSVCDLFGLPFYSFKLVSDYAQDKSHCDRILGDAENISKKLFDHYSKLKLPRQEKNKTVPEGFLPGTFTQKKTLESILSKLKLKNKSIDLPKEEEVKGLRPKEKMNLLLKKMQRELNPFESNLKQKLNHLTEDLDFKVEFTKDFEDSSIKLSKRIDSQEDLDEFKTSIQKFDYSKIIDLLEGKNGV
jgi:hypothetical protein